MKWQDVPGWCSFDDLYEEVVAEFPSGSHFVEVGSFFGRSALSMAAKIRQSGKKIRFDSIDAQAKSDCYHASTSFEYINRMKGVSPLQRSEFNKAMETGTTMRHAFEHFIKVCGDGDYINAIEGNDLAVVNSYSDASLDFFFLDADHVYETTKKSLLAWLPKMKPEGIFAGDDYTENFPGVIKAVDEVLGSRVVRRGVAWWLRL